MKALKALPLLIVLGYVIYIGLTSFLTNSGNIDRIPTPPEWYVGGTLHNASMKEWLESDVRNRMATSADLATVLAKPTMDQLKGKAVELEACITKGGSPKGAESMKVREIAAGCAVLLHY